MPRTRFVPRRDVGGTFAPVRAELDVPASFDPEAEAEAAAGPHLPAPPMDGRSWVTLDPASSRDLDQAFHLEEVPGGGWHLGYAIADVAAHVRPGGLVDAEAHRRGLTLYLPDGKAPLHPTVLSEGTASLLPGQPTPALVWEIDVAADGTTAFAGLARRTVTSVAKLAYDAPTDHAQLVLLGAAGPAMAAAAAARGAVDLPEPAQEIVPGANGSWGLVLRPQTPLERWNAQMSLSVGRAAGALQAASGWGLLRTLPEARPEDVEAVRRAAVDLGHGWPEGAPWGPAISSLDASDPTALAVIGLAARLLRGAGYTVLSGGRPQPHPPGHAGVAAVYAHATAPLRRLADRYVGECCLAAVAGTEPPPWATEGLVGLDGLMADANRKASAVDRACLDLVEALVLSDRVGETFDAVALDDRTVQVAEPAVRARCDGPLAPGTRVRVRLAAADVGKRAVRFAAALA